MDSPLRAGRIVGALLLLLLGLGLTTPYILLQRVSAGPADFLSLAAGMATQVRASVTMLFAGAALPIAISIAVWSAVHARAHALGFWLLALATANLSLQAVENSHWLLLLSSSEAYLRADASEAAHWTALAPTLRSGWKWAHYVHLLAQVSWLLLFFVALYRLAMLPRALAALGILTSLMQLGGITLPALLGYRVPFPMELYGMPLGVAMVAVAAWLLVKGLRQS
jgi:hypothetical protein